MNYKKRFKNDINNSIEKDKNYLKTINQLQFNEKEGIFSMKNKKLVIGLSAGCACAVVIGVGLGVGLGLNNKGNGEATSMVTLSLNPQISMVLDENNCVLSVSGDNNEGKIVVSGENLVGLNVNEAVSKVIQIESECGYLVSGQIEAGQNKLTVDLTIDDENIKKTVKSEIEKAINSTCNDLSIDKEIEYTSSVTKEALIEMVVSMDASLTKEDCANMTYKELLSRVAIYQLDTAEIYSVELEQLYNQSKEYEVKFADSEANKEAIASISNIYAAALSVTDPIIKSLKTSVENLETLMYSTLVDEESDFQKSYNSFLEAKQKVIKLKNEVANSEALSESEKEALNNELTAKEKILDACIETMDNFKESALATIQTAKDSIDSMINQINAIIKALPDQTAVENKLTECSKTIEDKINSAKKEAYDNFEKKYATEIKDAKDQALAYKEKLKNQLSENLTK